MKMKLGLVLSLGVLVLACEKTPKSEAVSRSNLGPTTKTEGPRTETTTAKTEGPRTEIIKRSDILSTTIGVRGMTCMGCEVTLEEALSKLAGVVSVKANHKEEWVKISYDHTKTKLGVLREAIREAGYSTFERPKNMSEPLP